MKPNLVQKDHVGVKICGVRTFSDAAFACDVGADAIGFNFWPQSKRYLNPQELSAWVSDIPTSVERIGVFVNAERDEVVRLIENGVIHSAQFHGDETQEYYLEMSQGFACMKAFTVRDESSLDIVSNFQASTVLLDAYCPGEYGGSGMTFEWSLGQRFVTESPGCSVVLAGGLRPDNVQSAIAQVSPAAVDVASGVESSPGIKDHSLVKDFVQLAHGMNIRD